MFYDLRSMFYEQFKRSIQPLINIYHLIKAISANVYYGFPSRNLKVIGVTGTDGKTTTAHLIYHILKSADKKVSMISSVYAKIGEDEYSTGLHVTTPDAIQVQRFLKRAVDSGDEYFVLETTSHALDQNRNYGIRYEVGIITNITHEHLDYHKTYDRYAKTKFKLLKQSKIGILNKDDDSYQLATSTDSVEVGLSKGSILAYGLKNKADFSIDLKKKLKLNIADFNNYNYLAAYSVAKSLGLKDEVIFNALKSFKLPAGRLEVVYDQDFKVVIDFAHTPNSLEQILKELKKTTKGKLIHVFGSAGLRDNFKRPAMGEASSRYADISIVTEEDYRTEDPDRIAREVASGIPNYELRIANKTLFFIQDRQQAINKAIEIAKKGDTVVCTGKSHEKSLNRNGKEYPWDEFEAVEIALKIKERKAKSKDTI